MVWEVDMQTGPFAFFRQSTAEPVSVIALVTKQGLCFRESGDHQLIGLAPFAASLAKIWLNTPMRLQRMKRL